MPVPPCPAFSPVLPTVPAVLVGAVLGPAAARLLDVQRWVDATATRQDDITMGVMRIMIGIQL